METYRVLVPPGHTQVEDSPGLSSSYTGSPGELLKSDLDTLCMAKCYRKDQQASPAQQRACVFSTFGFLRTHRQFVVSIIGSLTVQYTKLACQYRIGIQL